MAQIMLEVGQFLGPYRIVSYLGQGGMATVYKAHHAKLDRFVAVKMMHESFLADAQFITRFEREAQIIARLNHPNIVGVHDFAEDQGQPYLIMGFIDGITLKDGLTEGPLELADTLTILPLVASALDYAHTQGVLHRDIKPSNIMLDLKGKPYLTDFGLARTVSMGESSLSQGQLIGTPSYMSPEQGAGTQELTFRSDLYSFGIVIYELIVGKLPFEGTTYKILHNHQMAIPPVPSSINPEIPTAVDAMILQALSKDPDDRYSSATEMVVALRDAFAASRVTRLEPGTRQTIYLVLEKSQVKARESVVRLRAPSASTPANPSVTLDSMTTPLPPTTNLAISAPIVLTIPAPKAPPAPPSAPKATASPLTGFLGIAALAVAFVVVVGVTVAVIQSRSAPVTPLVTRAVLPTVQPSITEPPAVVIVPTASPTPTLIPMTTATLLPTQTFAPTLAAGGAPPTAQAQQNNGNNSSGGMTRLVESIAPIAPNVVLLEVPELTVNQAQTLVEQEPQNATAYLALVRARIQDRSHIPPQEYVDLIRQGGNVAQNVAQYQVTLLTILPTLPSPPPMLTAIYNDLLSWTSGTDLNLLVRLRASTHLYELATNLPRQEMSSQMIDEINTLLNNQYDPLFFAILARFKITLGLLDDAEATLARTNAAAPEVRLIAAELLSERGQRAQARLTFAALAANSEASAWVRTTAALLARP